MRRYAVVVVSALGLAALAYAPLVAHPNSTVLLEPGDASSAARNYWASNAIGKLPFTMAHDPLVQAPEGAPASTALQISNSFEPFFVLALAWFAGYLSALNAYLVAGVVLTGIAMFALLDRLRMHPVASAAGAVAFASSQWAVEQALYGHVSFTHLWVYPVLLLSLLWAREGSPRRGAVVGIAYAVSFAVFTYLGLFASLVVAVFLLAVALERRSLRPRRGDLRRFAWGAGAAFVGLLPAALAPKLGPSSRLGLPNGSRADLEGSSISDYLRPSVHHSLYGHLAGGSVGEHVVFFGYAVLALAVGAAIAIFRRRLAAPLVVRFALLLVPISVLMSFPAYGHVAGKRVPLPDAAWVIGGVVHWFRSYSRYGVVAGFGLVILAAYGLDALIRARRPATLVLSALAVLLIGFEAAPGFPVVSQRIRPEATVDWLRAHPGGITAVYPNVPWTTPNTDGNPVWTSFTWDTLFLQTRHGHPLYSLPRIDMNDRRADEIRVLTSDLENPQTAGILRAEGVRYVVVRDDIYRSIKQVPPAAPPGLRLVARVRDGRIFRPTAQPVDVAAALSARQVELARAYSLASASVGFGRAVYQGEPLNGGTIHWMQQDASVLITQLVARPFVTYRLTITAFSAAIPRRVELTVDGRGIGSFDVGTSTTTITRDIELPQRTSTLTIHADPGPARLSDADPRVASICIVSVAVDPVQVNVTGSAAGTG